MKRSRWLFCLWCLIAGQSSPSYAQTECAVETLSATAVSGRAFSIELANGVSIRVVGHEHGDRETQGKILGTLANPQVANSQVMSRVHPWVKSLAKTLTQYRGDVAFVNHFLIKNPASILWAEGSENALDEIRSLLRTATKLRSGVEMRDALLLAAGPILYLEATGKLPEATRVQGVEEISPEIQEDWAKAEALKKDSLSFWEIQNANPAAFHAAAPLLQDWNKMLDDGKVDELLNFDLSEINKIVDAGGFSTEITRSLKMRLQAYLLDHQSSIKRDRVNVQKIIQQDKPGIFLVGLLHVDPTLTFLQRSCRN